MTQPQILDLSPARPRRCAIFVSYYVFHMAVSILLVGLWAYYTPHFESSFNEFRTKLPAITEITINLSHLARSRYAWISVVPALFIWPLLPATLAVVNAGHPRRDRWVSAGITVFYLICILIVCLALVVPMYNLIHHVSGST